uniref:uracil-DNA glycosylase family protein n=1 Tax=Roseivirga sp. TaxID=1964215 RepID=UPI004048C8DF
MNTLLSEIKNCTVCTAFLPNPPKPVLQVSTLSKIMIIGQAPGQKVQDSGIPWDDASGNNLRNWLGVDDNTFYDQNIFALVPMGFCFPGTGKSGDLPPRPECAPLWHKRLLEAMQNVRLTILIGQYAQNYYLADRVKSTLTETVNNFREYLPKHLPLPHPSPRNNIWQKKNSWFKEEVIPVLQAEILKHLQ